MDRCWGCVRLAAFNTSRECERAIPQMVASQMKIGNNRTGRPDAGVVFAWRGTLPRPSNEEPLTRYEWSCWPDTIDPRASKERWVLWTPTTAPGARVVELSDLDAELCVRNKRAM